MHLPAYARHFGNCDRQPTKLLRIMRLMAVLLTVCCMQVAANVRSQEITFSGHPASLEKIFRHIEQTTGFYLFYKSDLITGLPPVHIEAVNMPLAQFLNIVLRDQPLSYAVTNTTITINRKNPAPSYSFISPNAPPITGKIMDERGNALPGATVTIKRKGKSVTTDEYGNFFIEANLGDVLEVTYVGFNRQSVILGDLQLKSGRPIVIQLTAAISNEQEVVVNAGYYSVAEREATGNISTVTTKTIEKQPVINVMGALSGRVAGLDITQNTGVPGAGFTVRIRGQNSITSGNNPLYILDGVPLASETLGSYQVNRISTFGDGQSSPLNNLNPADIASIEVLKDADATAIYGSRGANGVILITTKKGKAGKTTATVNLTNGISQVTRYVKLMNTDQYLSMRKEAFANEGITDYPAEDFDVNGTWDQHRYTDWQKELYGQTANNLNIQGTVSGGNESTQFLVRAGYQREGTVFAGDGTYDRGSVLMNLVHKSSDDRFHLSITNTFSIDGNDVVSSNLVDKALYLAPNAPAVYQADGSLNWENSTWDNPLSYLEGTYEATTSLLGTNAVLSYSILKDLDVKVNLGYNDYRLDEANYFPSTMYNPAYHLSSNATSVFSNSSRRQSWIIEPQASWKKAWGKGIVQLLAGATYSKQNAAQISQYSSGFTSNSQMYDLSAANFQLTTSNYSLYKYQAIFGRLNYAYNEKYILNVTARHDGSSRFGPGKQFATFGAIGGSWIFSEEEWVRRSLPFLSLGKLRGSYGTTGNDQIGDYEFLNTYATYSGRYQNVRGLVPQRLYNADFGWETNRKFELGTEIGLARDRLLVRIAWYKNRSSNQLVGIPLPGMTGFTSIRSNLGAVVQNRGWEFEVTATPLAHKRFKWSTAFTLTLPKNKLISYPGLEQSTYRNSLVIGRSLSITKLFQFTGFDPTAGTFTFEDFNKDGAISFANDRNIIKDLSIQYYGGLSNTLNWRNWQLDVFLQYVRQTKAGALQRIGMPGTLANQPVSIVSHWPGNGQEAVSQKYATTYANSDLLTFFQYSDQVYTDASYVRLKNVSLSYQAILSDKHHINGRFFIQGQNLLTFTGYDGGDPESSFGYLPALRTIVAGIQLTF